MKILSSFLAVGTTALFLVSNSPDTHSTSANVHEGTGASLYDSVRATLAGYRWPTEDFLSITSSFADFRSTHFHGGIDISTHRKKGYRVFASKSGYVAHISISPYGYGKLLLIQHPDGYRTAYAHLSRLNDTLQAYVELLQHRQDQYPLEVSPEPNQFPVNQGDVIAYTGDTGIGVAHLHFEIHDEQFNPVNPLLVPEFAKYTKDSNPPEIRRIAFVPLEPGSFIDGHQKPLVMSATRLSAKEYRFRNVVHCTGTVGVELYAMDHSDDTWYRSTATDLELWLDSTLVTASRITRVLLGETKQVALHFDWGFYKSRRWYFQKLFVEPGDEQPFYSGDSSNRSGLRTNHFAPGTHTVRVVASDVFGNHSTISGTVVFNHPPTIEVVRDSGRATVRVASSSPLQSISVSSPAGKGWSAKNYPASQLEMSGSTYELPLTLQRHRVLRVIAENRFGTRSVPAFIITDSLNPKNVSFRFRKTIHDHYVSMTVQSDRLLSSPPLLEATSAAGTTSVPLQQTELYRYEGIYTPSPGDGGVIRVSARLNRTDKNPRSLDEFTVFPVTPEDGGIVRSRNGAFELQFGRHGVYKPTYFHVQETSEGYSVTPTDVLLDKGVTVRYVLPRKYDGKAGLFAGKEILDWTRTKEKDTLTGKVDNFVGPYSILEDDAPPEISRVSVYYSRGRVRLSFRVVDDCAGIDPTAIRIRIDNEVMIGEFDPYAHYVRSEEYHPLTRGTHTVTIESSDRMANKTVVHRSLVVSRRTLISTQNFR